MSSVIHNKRVGVKLRDRYYLCMVTSTPGSAVREVTAVCVKNADRTKFQIRSERADRPGLVDLLTEGLDRRLHLDRFVRTLARIPHSRSGQQQGSGRPQSAPQARRNEKHGRVLSMTDESDGEDMGALEDVVTGGLTPRTVRLLKERRRGRGKGEEEEEEEDGIEHEGGKVQEEEEEEEGHRGTRRSGQGLEKQRVGGKEVVPSLRRLMSLPSVLDATGLARPGFSPRDPEQRVDTHLLRRHVASSARPLRDTSALQRERAKARSKPTLLNSTPHTLHSTTHTLSSTSTPHTLKSASATTLLKNNRLGLGGR